MVNLKKHQRDVSIIRRTNAILRGTVTTYKPHEESYSHAQP